MDDEQWWLHLYVMFSCGTSMGRLWLLRPPPRELLEKGPPPSVKKALERFATSIGTSERAALTVAQAIGMDVPS